MSEANFLEHAEIRDDFKSPGILLAAKKLDYLVMSEKERRAYDDYLAYLGQEMGILDTAKEEGRVEGRVEGKVEGWMEEKIEMARKMLRDNETFNKIIKWTELPLEKIQQLVREKQ